MKKLSSKLFFLVLILFLGVFAFLFALEKEMLSEFEKRIAGTFTGKVNATCTKISETLNIQGEQTIKLLVENLFSRQLAFLEGSPEASKITFGEQLVEFCNNSQEYQRFFGERVPFSEYGNANASVFFDGKLVLLAHANKAALGKNLFDIIAGLDERERQKQQIDLFVSHWMKHESGGIYYEQTEKMRPPGLPPNFRRKFAYQHWGKFHGIDMVVEYTIFVEEFQKTVRDVEQMHGNLIDEIGREVAASSEKLFSNLINLFAVLFTVLAAVFSVVNRILILRPVNVLMEGLKNFANRRFSEKIVLASSEEFGTIADISNKMATQLSEAIGNLETLNDELELKVKERTSELQTSNNLLLDEKGKTDRLLADLDETNRKLSDRHQKLGALIDSVPDGIYVLDPQDRLVMANPVASRRMAISGLPPEGLPLVECRKALWERLSRQGPGEAGRFQDPTGGAWYKVISTPLLDSSGKCFGSVVVEHDFTLEHEIDRMKSEFVSNVSHELRTPLTSIQACAEMLIDGETDDPAKGKEYLEIILSETQRLTRLINDVLDLSRIESGRQVVRKTVVNPAEIVGIASRTMNRWASSKGHSLKVSVGEKVDSLNADRDLLEQALLNLLSNSVKYTPDGGTITISVDQRDGEIRFAVRDTGIGMSPIDREKLFTKFFRAENDLVKQAGGTGLGLVLVGEIARIHAGRVEVESSPGNGSTFTLCIPVQPPEK